MSALNPSGITGNHNGDSNPAAPALLLRLSPHLVPLMLGLLVRGIPGFQIQKTHARSYFPPSLNDKSIPKPKQAESGKRTLGFSTL